MSDNVNHPSHYTQLPRGLEVIDITSNFDFVIGNALKYILRHQYKGEAVQDLKKAIWYLQYRINQLEGGEE